MTLPNEYLEFLQTVKREGVHLSEASTCHFSKGWRLQICRLPCFNKPRTNRTSGAISFFLIQMISWIFVSGDKTAYIYYNTLNFLKKSVFRAWKTDHRKTVCWTEFHRSYAANVKYLLPS